MINYAGEEINIKGCLGCSFSKHEFSLPCGIAYENDKFILSQDWELPITGFFVVAPKKHVESLLELSNNERIEIFEIANKTIEILEKNKVCNNYNMILEEKNKKHFHIWIMPRHEWMEKFDGGIINNIGKIFEYSKLHMRTKENLEEIRKITNIVEKGLKNKFK